MDHRSDATGAGTGTADVAEVITDIWTDVLGVDHVEPEDDFFALGGHSLLAVQVMARIEEELGITTTLRTLIECPTVESLAGALERS